MGKFKKGDKIICKPGYTGHSGNKDDMKYGGAGHREGVVIYTVRYIAHYPQHRDVVFVNELPGLGCYIDAIEQVDIVKPIQKINKFNFR